MKKLLSMLMLVALVTVVSCKKDDPAPSKTSLISTGSWLMTKITVKVNSGAETDVTTTYQDVCYQDDIYTFTSAGVFTEDVGADDCDGDATKDTGKWKFSTDEKLFTITLDGDDQAFDFISITSSTFILSETEKVDIDGDGVKESLISKFTFTKK